MESDKQHSSRLDRDSHYRIAALQCAVHRAGQDGGISGDTVDVFNHAEQYYAWLKGGNELQKPAKETFKKTKGINNG